jgi:hypothetical protein
MKKIYLSIFLILSAFISFAQGGKTPDWATKAGAFGVGASPSLQTSTINGLNYQSINSSFGFSFLPRFAITDRIIAEGRIGFGATNVGSSFADTSGSFEWEENLKGLRYGVRGQYVLAYYQRATLSALFGVDILSTNGEYTQGNQPPTDVEVKNTIIGLGVRGEYFPTQYLSLFQNSVGISIFIEADVARFTKEDINGFEESGTAIFAPGDLWGSAGFTVWFK